MVERIEPDLDKLMGKPDGPYRFIPELGVEVPTYIDPRIDLIPESARGFKRLDYHVPFGMRGPFKPQWFDPKYYAQYGQQFQTDHEGYVLCAGKTLWKSTSGRKLETPTPCKKLAVNRTAFCQNHGSALHPADKKLSGKNLSVGRIEPDRIENLDRVQKFLAGFITVQDLDDDEVIGAYVRNNDGKPISNSKFNERFQQDMVRELIRRMQRLMQMKLPNMIKAMTDIAESQWAEPADRIKAAQWVAERVIGKVPEVLALSVSNKPIDQILGSIQGGSREEYRRSIASSRPSQEIIDVLVVDDESDLEPDGNNEPNGVHTDSKPVDVRTDGDSNPNTGVVDRVDRAIAERDEAKEIKRKIKVNRARRFAMRAQGVTSENDLGWLIDYTELTTGGFKATLVPPEAQTEAKLARMAEKALAQGA